VNGISQTLVRQQFGLNFASSLESLRVTSCVREKQHLKEGAEQELIKIDSELDSPGRLGGQMGGAGLGEGQVLLLLWLKPGPPDTSQPPTHCPMLLAGATLF
jgi:hypothetical protein